MSLNTFAVFDIELSEEFQASESSDNFSQEIKKPTKKKTASKKVKQTPKSKKQGFLAVKSTAGSSKAPKKKPGKGTPLNTTTKANKEAKGTKKNKKSTDNQEKKEMATEQSSEGNRRLNKCMIIIYE